ncbi:MAG: Unknown protein [uncultured Thiotrichaceae bacterium]|uniref:Uncharacterized protein n=1 Tax=uncultured Thiotrichaceae bacterium TaxID=298394 RepID=A0A6S6T8Q8_9GAMM|nr:MAG: Unknown protein [uncultured Thiotrichaceae bacterium]
MPQSVELLSTYTNHSGKCTLYQQHNKCLYQDIVLTQLIINQCSNISFITPLEVCGNSTSQNEFYPPVSHMGGLKELSFTTLI